jgi:hypothetical protein
VSLGEVLISKILVEMKDVLVAQERNFRDVIDAEDNLINCSGTPSKWNGCSISARSVTFLSCGGSPIVAGEHRWQRYSLQVHSTTDPAA